MKKTSWTKKKPRTQYHDQQRPKITIGELTHLKKVQEVLLDILFPPFVFCCHTYTQWDHELESKTTLNGNNNKHVLKTTNNINENETLHTKPQPRV
jgi:hypothetical protein